MNHYKDGGIEPDVFTVCAINDKDDVTVQIPMWSDEQSVAQMTFAAFGALFHFVEQFFFAVLAARLPDELGVLKASNVPLYEPQSPIHIMRTSEFEAIRAKGGWSSRGDPL